MSGFDSLWGDELTEDDVAECVEIETQASQIPVTSSFQLQRVSFNLIRINQYSRSIFDLYIHHC